LSIANFRYIEDRKEGRKGGIPISYLSYLTYSPQLAVGGAIKR